MYKLYLFLYDQPVRHHVQAALPIHKYFSVHWILDIIHLKLKIAIILDSHLS